jgi:hypothetical protein
VCDNEYADVLLGCVLSGARRFARLTERLVAALLGPADANISSGSSGTLGADRERSSNEAASLRNLMVPSLRMMYFLPTVMLVLEGCRNEGDISDGDGVGDGVVFDGFAPFDSPRRFIDFIENGVAQQMQHYLVSR